MRAEDRRFCIRTILFGLRLLILGAVLNTVTTRGSLLAQEASVPADIQAVIFKKTFAYVRTLNSTGSAGSARVLIVYDGGSAKAMDEIRKAFEQVHVETVAVQEAELVSRMQEGSIVYIATPRGSYRQLLQKTRSLSITGLLSVVQRGDASIGLTLQDSKPKILVNLSELKAEGHEVASNLLQLAQVIQ